jgi:DNA-binding transcriptional ArsR family regulator
MRRAQSTDSPVAGTFSALADPTRLRTLLLLQRMELTVSELTEVLGVAQSTASGLLRVILQAGLAESRREGRRAFYRAAPTPGWLDGALGQVALSADDLQALERIRSDRLDSSGGAEDPLLAAFDDNYLPGRSWKGLSRALLLLARLGRVADLGVGSGDLSLLLARSSQRLYAVDREPDALAELELRAAQEGLDNVVAVAGALEDVVLPERVDLVACSLVLHCVEEPSAVLRRAHELLDDGGQIWITELASHEHTWVRDKLGHRRLGFSREALESLLVEAGFSHITIKKGARDRRAPRFATWIALARRSRAPARGNL